MVGQALQDYQEFHTISKPTRKDRENTRLHKSHATRFVLHMHQKCPSNRFVNMKFIYNFHQIQQWPVVLLSQKYTTTSVKNMMLNASMFISHVKAFHSETSSLTNTQFDRILLQFKKLQKDNSRRIKAHQQTVKWNKSSEYMLPFTHTWLWFPRPPPLTILALFVLQNCSGQAADYGTFMHIAGYRVPRLTGVFTKTDRTFGNAYKTLLPHEVDWLKGLIEVSTAHFGRQCPFVFQFEGKQFYKLNCELKAAWHHSGMQSQISFGLIRTAIANQAKKHLPAEERKLVCEAMCHDVSTADRFYTSVPEIGDVFRI
ncbi:hypothetical protein MHYP_G00206930 [Metynnis hypsauchen]